MSKAKGKDPAVLWYWNDWHGGTVTFTRHLKGCYMDLLYAQFNNGHLSLEEIRTVLGTDFSHWDTLRKKFAQDAAGKFFNEKLDQVKADRKAFSEEQSKKAKKRWGDKNGNAAALPIENENATVNEYLNSKKVSEENISELRTDVIFHERVCMATSISLERMKTLLERFIAEKSVGDELSKPLNDCRSHFVNWVKIEIGKEKKLNPPVVAYKSEKFPSRFDPKFEASIKKDPAKLAAYHKHLEDKGLEPFERNGVVVDWTPKNIKVA